MEPDSRCHEPSCTRSCSSRNPQDDPLITHSPCVNIYFLDCIFDGVRAHGKHMCSKLLTMCDKTLAGGSYPVSASKELVKASTASHSV